MALPAVASGYTFKRTAEGAALHWPAGSDVEYVVHRDGVDDIADGSDLRAVADAFDSWQSIDGMNVRFVHGGATDSKEAGYDQENPEANVNTVAWIESDWPFDDAALAVTLSVFLTDTGELLDSDILFNGDHFSWTTASAGGHGHDVQNAATHEIGHFLSISHSVRVPDSTMYPGTSAGELTKRTLHADDIAAVRTLYTDLPPEEPAQIEDPGPGAQFPEPPPAGGPLASSAGPASGDAAAQAPPAGEAEGHPLADPYSPGIGLPDEPEIKVFSGGCSTAPGAVGTPESGRNRGSVAGMALVFVAFVGFRRRRTGLPREEDQS